ncbi:MAG: 3-hydroxyacyl-CoA dehydrogenase/enoyl-CoA hydratase family protein, partial [Bacteroidetes bacterium]|nr:3-hydroxyacyl-CoA dehydrogenase/enoyl-CoA hydratase family protein [Bacteroidota bacterium]
MVIEATKRKIRTVAVLGSGVMGSRLALHFANIGVKVYLLDIPPRDPNEANRNAVADSALKAALKSSPSPIYRSGNERVITTGNLDDDLAVLAKCDWILEAVIEDLQIKRSLFEKVEQFRKSGTLITSNTSGIPIRMMAEGRSEDFKQHFCGTHFFNPPRYLRLLEIIPTGDTHAEVTNFLMHYGDLFLGKQTVLCKDTPAFIANRIGVFSIMAIFHLMQEMDMTIEEVDAVTGPISGRPKSATFRTSDLVGLDTLVKVANGVHQNCPDDEASSLFAIPDFLQEMVSNNMLGDKTGGGFYKKVKGADGRSEILTLDLKTMEYRTKDKPRFESIGQARQAGKLSRQLKVLATGDDKAAKFFQRLHLQVFAYCSFRIPEIADHLYQIDDGMRAGFNWELGPFEIWDILGLKTVAGQMKSAGLAYADWVDEAISAGISSFYQRKDGKRFCYNIESRDYEVIPGTEEQIVLDNYRSNTLIWGNKGASLHDIGDGVLCLEFHTKMNAIGSEILFGINKAIDIAEQDGWNGLVIGNDAPNFTAGANLAMMLMLAIEQEFDELNMAIRYFQKTVMRLRYSAIPVVIAPHGLTLGGGCEMSLHADSAVASAETYIGLVEFGAGVIPGGGGTKEFVVRASDSFYNGDPELPTLQERFTTIATAKVATSGFEAFDIGVLHTDKDEVV